MKFQSVPFATLAVLFNVATTASACTFERIFDDGSTVEVSGVETFNVAPGASTTCSVTCDSGALTTLYMRYGGEANAVFNDGTSFNPIGCDVSVPIVSAEEEYELGWSVGVLSPFTNLKIACSCSQAGDGDDRFLGGGCFSESAEVEVLNKGTTAMKDLNVGDKVLADGGKYQTVYSWGHYHETMEQEFLQIFTKENGKVPLEMTGDHMIYVTKDGQQHPVRADTLKEGETLVQASAQQATISKISSIKKNGVYMPLTSDGTVMVNKLKVSAYVSVLEEEAPTFLALKSYFGIASEQIVHHWWLSPYRMLCMGVSPKFCTENAHNEEGILNWFVQGRKFSCFAEEQNVFVQFGLALATFAVFGFFNVVEFFLGATLAPSIVCLVAGIMWFFRRASETTTEATKKTV